MAPAAEFSEQRQRDDALAASGATGDHDDTLVVRLSSLAHGVQDHLVRHALLIQEDELLTVLDLRGSEPHELLGRPYRAVEQTVAGTRTGL